MASTDDPSPKIRLATREDIPHILSMIHELAAFENASHEVRATESSLALTLALAPSPHRHHHHEQHSEHKPSADGTKHAHGDSHAHNAQMPPDAPFDRSAHSMPTQSSGYAKTLILFLPSNGNGSGSGSDGEEQIIGMALYFHTYSTWLAQPGIYLEDLFIRPAFRRRGYATLLLRELAKEVLRIGGGRLEWSCLDWNEGALGFYEASVEEGGCGAVRKSEWVGLRVEGEGVRRLADGRGKIGEMSA